MAGYQKTPETNELLQQLMGILQKNRAEREGAEQQQARLNASSGFAQGLKGGMGQQKPEAEAPAAPAQEEPLIRPGAAGGSSKGRVGIGQRYIEAQQQAQGNPYGVYLAENDTAAGPPTDAGALEEQKKRFTQNLMNSRGQSGGPLGGAGAPPPSNMPTAHGVDPSVVGAVSGAGGPVAQMNPPPGAAPMPASAPMPTPAAAQGLPQPDLAMLDWAAARQARGM